MTKGRLNSISTNVNRKGRRVRAKGSKGKLPNCICEQYTKTYKPLAHTALFGRVSYFASFAVKIAA